MSEALRVTVAVDEVSDFQPWVERWPTTPPRKDAQ